MNSTNVAKNSRNSVKDGDRHSSAGCTQLNYVKWNGAPEIVSGPPTKLCNCCHSASGRSKTWSLSFRSDPSSGSRVLHLIRGEEISPTMKVRAVETAATIRTAERARGTRWRSRYPAAGDSMVPTTNAVTTGRKNAFAT